MAVLNGEQAMQLYQALLKAFPSRSALEVAVYYQLGTQLPKITKQSTLDDMVVDLVQWAEAHDKTDELINVVLTVNPGNPDLQAFAKQYHTASSRLPSTYQTVSPRLPSANQHSAEGTVTRHLRTKLVEALLSLPETATFDGRRLLLTGLPWTATLQRSSTRVPDLHLLVDQLSSLGQLKSGTWPLLLLMDNAIAYAEGTTSEETLRDLRKQLASDYAATAA